MAVLVEATTAHSFPVTVTAPATTAARFLGDISNRLDHLGLLRGEHWSLEAEVEGERVSLRFALSSQEAADQLKAVLIDTVPDEFSEMQSDEAEQVSFGIGGPASAKFLDVFRIPKNTKMQPLAFQDPTEI